MRRKIYRHGNKKSSQCAVGYQMNFVRDLSSKKIRIGPYIGEYKNWAMGIYGGLALADSEKSLMQAKSSHPRCCIANIIKKSCGKMLVRRVRRWSQFSPCLYLSPAAIDQPHNRNDQNLWTSLRQVLVWIWFLNTFHRSVVWTVRRVTNQTKKSWCDCAWTQRAAKALCNGGGGRKVEAEENPRGCLGRGPIPGIGIESKLRLLYERGKNKKISMFRKRLWAMGKKENENEQ